MKRGGAGNPLGEKAVFEDMKQAMKRGGAGNPLGENAVFNVFDDMKQGVEPVTLSVKMPSLKIGNKRMKRGGAGNPFGENAVFEDMKLEDEKGWSR